jgi:hypothetical protein
MWFGSWDHFGWCAWGRLVYAGTYVMAVSFDAKGEEWGGGGTEVWEWWDFQGGGIVVLGGSRMTFLVSFHTAAEPYLYEKGSPSGGFRGCFWGVWVSFGAYHSIPKGRPSGQM